MAIQELHFTKDWNNAEDFPVAAKNVAQARANVQALHDETKDYINNKLVPALQDASNFSKHCWRVRDFDMVTGEPGDLWRYVYSDDRHAYPDSEVVDGFEYEYIGVPIDFATPPGGNAWQVLAKASDADHDYMWADLAGVSGGGGGAGAGAVRYDISQALKATQKQMARDNIGAASKTLSITVEGLVGRVDGLDEGFEGIKLQVADATGKVTTLKQTVDEILLNAGDGNSNNGALSVKVNEIEASVKKNTGDIGRLSVKSDEIEQRVENAEGDVGALEIQAQQIVQRVSDAEGNIASFETRVDNISAKVTDAEGEIGQLQLKSDEIEQRVENAEGDIGALEVQAQQIVQRVEDAEGNIASFETRVDGISAKVTDAEGEIGQLKLKSDEFSTKISEVEGDAEENAAKYSQIKQMVENISFTVSDPINGGTNRYVTISLTVGGNTHTGVVMIDGNVEVSGQLSAEALYATLGDIARLKVDSLSTSRRIPMYLAGDESDDNYIDVQEQHIALRRAWTDGSEEQARDDFGALLYWEQDIDGADIGSDGYPYVNGARVFITTEETDWPVMVYSYESGDRLRIMFDEDNNYGPRMVWGEGDGSASGKGRGYIEKLGLSFDIYNKGTDGVKRGVFMGNDFTDIVGQRRPTKIAFSGDVCNITLEGGITNKLTFNRNSTGQITSVTDSNGHTCTLEGLE